MLKIARDRFQGCLVGSVIGDCLGAPFEMQNWNENGIPRQKILSVINPKELADKYIQLKYTDDTAMAKSVCSSLLQCKEFDAVDLAKRFTEEYFKEPDRGYGSNIVFIFEQWKNAMKTELNFKNVLYPSTSQFDGKGSYGNGAAMRVSCIALFTLSLEDCIDLAKKASILTHSNKNGYNGAILQALSVRKAIRATCDIDPIVFVDELIDEMKHVESFSGEVKRNTESLYDWTRSQSFSFTHQLEIIKKLLIANNTESKENDVKLVNSVLGRDISAQQAVPAALYSFLRNLKFGFEETLYYAISLGGDTDTIAAMCGAIAGSYYGLKSIPHSWFDVCEFSREMQQFADDFFELHKS
ncbi:ADP-ribosylhydrolase ARH3 isoform X1 [Hydra vulgaris]|uniref:ADP-ribosylhydrolase ARH3 n=1 Tax=Hydra vulgaris TaxID=6087 RepID=A0ABM4CJZ6_HYDVU